MGIKTSSRVAGRYRLHAPILADGMGVRWAATDERSGLPVAVRILERGLENTHRIAHFLQSALSSARLAHPNIARVLDEGHDPLGPFIVTEWLDGVPLSEWRRSKPEWGFLRPVMTQLLDALACIHASGLVHLDLRPENVLIRQTDAGPEVFLTDIGCARIDDPLSDRSAGARATMKYLGSLRYMAPEVADSPPWMIGPWSDLYSFGLILWELLAGDIPHPGLDGVALLLQRAGAGAGAPTLPAEVGGAHHHALNDLLSRVLARNPEERARGTAQARRTIQAIEAPVAWATPRPYAGYQQPAMDRARAIAADFPLWPLAPGPLVGQTAAQAKVWRALQAVVNGYGSRLVLIEGPASSGRSHLLQTVAEQAVLQGSATVWNVDFEGGAGLLGALEALLRAGTTDADGVARRARALPLLHGVAPEGLDVVLPALLRPDPTPFARPGNEPDPGIELGSVGSAHMVAGAFLTLLTRAARNDALLLCLDDAHLASAPEGIDLVERLLCDPSHPVCVVVTTHIGEPGAAALRSRFPEGERCEWIDLKHLDETQMARYIQARLALVATDEARVITAITAQPTLMRAMCDHLLDGHLMPSPEGNRLIPGTLLPESLHELMTARLRRLPADEGDALVPDTISGLAFAQSPLMPAVVQALRDDDPHRPYSRALAAAERIRLMQRRANGGWRFSTAGVAEWLQRRAASRADSWHRRWLSALLRLEGTGRGRLGVERAAHAQALGQVESAVESLLEAAAWALGPGQQALEHGVLASQRAASLAEALGRPLVRAHAIRLQAELHRQAGRLVAARQALLTAEGLLDPDSAPVELGWCLLTRAWLDVDERQLARAAEGFHDAQALFEAAQDRGGATWSFIGNGRVSSLQGHHRLARTTARRAEDVFTKLGAQRGILAAQLLRATAADAAHDYDVAERRYAAMQALADRRRWLLDAVTLRLHRARLALLRGRPHDALTLLAAARDAASVARLVRLHEWVDAVRPAALAAAGERHMARSALNRARLPNARLCGSACAAINAAIAHPTTGLDEVLRQALINWCARVAAHAEIR